MGIPSRHPAQPVVCREQNIGLCVFCTGDMQRVIRLEPHPLQRFSSLNHCVAERNTGARSFQYFLQPIPSVLIGNDIHFMVYDDTSDPLPLAGLFSTCLLSVVQEAIHMSKIACFSVGRSEAAAITILHETVSPR